MGIGLAIAGAWTAIGSATIAGVAIGTALQGAIIGAAIGGITAAVSGGSIGTGILFGAIGGAVAGGITSYFTPGVTGATGGISQAAGQTAAHSANALNVAGTAVGHTVGQTTAASTSSLLGTIGSQVLSTGLTTGIQGYLANEAAADLAKDKKKESALAHERNKEILKLQSSLSKSGSGTAQAVDNTGAELAYNARMAELDQRKNEFDTQTSQTRKEWDTEMERRSQRRALFSGGATSAAPTVSEGTSDGGSIIEKRQDNVELAPTAAPTAALAGSTEAAPVEEI